jgi:O-antigen ligase
MLVIFLTGVFESLYGMFEFFSGRHHILYLKGISSVTGTFINRNYFAGYLLMVIPLSMGFFFSREALHGRRFQGWRQRLSSLDGKTLLIGFGIIVMILGLLFSASRMGILSLLLSFTLISILFKASQAGKGFSKTTILILGLALLWALWIGLDAVIGRFFDVSEDLKWRWAIWADAFKVVEDFPILGSGLGTFSQIFPMYKSFHIRRFVSHAENDFLQLASEVGLIGVGILLILFIGLFVKVVCGIRSISITDSRRYIGIGGLVGILALMFHSMVERNLQVPANAFLFTFLWALILRMGSFKQSERAMAGEIR